MSNDSGGSPNTHEIRQSCSSSFLPRKSGTPTQISYYSHNRYGIQTSTHATLQISMEEV